MAINFVFDMDGTIADLYAVENWLPMLHAEETTPYEVAEPMYDMVALNTMLVETGATLHVVSWGAMNATAEYTRRVKAAKVAWVEKYLPCIDKKNIHVVKYGTPKHRVIRGLDNAILFDDNADVRNAWTLGEAVDATKNIMEAIANMAKM